MEAVAADIDAFADRRIAPLDAAACGEREDEERCRDGKDQDQDRQGSAPEAGRRKL
ncbi:MAG: hypothetical protein ACTHJ3_02900 [Pararhizobium sp.]